MKTGKLLFLILSVAVAMSADKKEPFRPGDIDKYANKQSNQGVTIAAQPYDNPDDLKIAFGKLNPYEHGVLPVLVLIRNDSKTALKMDGLQTMYMAPRGRKIESTPPKDVMLLEGTRAKRGPTITGGIKIKVQKSKLNDPVIEERAFAAKMLPPGDTAYGFVYFQTGYSRGTSLYLSGLSEAGTGKALFFFEVPLD